ncbi:MAG: Gfo/Idh/MocA family oxidoreductase [Cellulomonadaceae bacterium]|jgi:predicted dehydrogenase|nr:Gfo/Idh/MocA family oxidoreductase [Cellulomonadaceae bacterium]
MKTYNVGVIGAGFMAKAHSMAYAAMPMFFWPAPGIPVRYSICDVTADLAADAASRLGFTKSTDDWRTIVNDPDVDAVSICTPNDSHAEIAIAAARNGKHILCEKPLANTAAEAKAMVDAVVDNNVTNMLAFNYRHTPAVALAREIIDSGEIGTVQTFRGTYLQDWSADASTPLSWRFQSAIAGSGALGDIGTHVIDLARYLVGEINEVAANLKTYIPQRPLSNSTVDKLGAAAPGVETAPMGAVDVDDEASFAVRFADGATGSIEATRNAWGRNNFITFEIHGSAGSIYFDYEHRDELRVAYASDRADRRGFRIIQTGPQHPYGDHLWPIPALGIGYCETKIVETYEFFKAITDGTQASPNFADGLAICHIVEAIQRSHLTDGAWTHVTR